MDFNQVYRVLPKVLADMVSEYNAEHRKLMSYVFDELDNEVNVISCANDEGCCYEFHIMYNEHIETEILGNTYYFCCEDCAGYGEWSIRYDYRKSMRSMRLRAN